LGTARNAREETAATSGTIVVMTAGVTTVWCSESENKRQR
jgi:hypothetical protein